MNKLIADNFDPLVSIVIPVYNGANFVREAIESALSQTYKKVEVIVVNDGSTDDTEQIAKSFGKKIKYLSKENGGVASALNLAIQKSRGDYISWLSHDDLYSKEKIKSQIECIRQLNPKDRNGFIVYSNYRLIDKSSRILSSVNFELQHKLDKLNSTLYPLVHGLINGCTLLIPKKCFDDVGVFNIDLRATQDYDLWFRMFPKYNIVFLSDQLVSTRIHDLQSTRTLMDVKKECSRLWIGVVNRLSNRQKILSSGSKIQFYTDVYSLVRDAGYADAERYISRIISNDKSRQIADVLVSVIIPFYNEIDNVDRAIVSVLNQTHQNLELILIDDNSSQNIDILKRYLSDSRVRYYRNSSNMGQSYSRNLGMNKATGEYISFLDADDKFLADKISHQLRYMIRHGLSITHTSYYRVNEHNRTTIAVNSGSITYNYPEIISDCAIATPTVMMHKDLTIRGAIKFPTHIHIGEDTCLWISISRNFPIVGIQKKLTKVYVNESSSTQNKYKQITGLTNICNYVLNEYFDDGLGELTKVYTNLIGLLRSVDTKFQKKSYIVYRRNILFSTFIYLVKTRK